MTRWGHIFNVIYDIKKSEHLNCLIPSAWILIYNAYYETSNGRTSLMYNHFSVVWTVNKFPLLFMFP